MRRFFYLPLHLFWANNLEAIKTRSGKANGANLGHAKLIAKPQKYLVRSRLNFRESVLFYLCFRLPGYNSALIFCAASSSSGTSRFSMSPESTCALVSGRIGILAKTGKLKVFAMPSILLFPKT